MCLDRYDEKLLIDIMYSLYQKFVEKERMNYNSPDSLIFWMNGGMCSNGSNISSIRSRNERIWTIVIHSLFFHKVFDTDYMSTMVNRNFEMETFPVIWGRAPSDNDNYSL